VKSMVLKWIKCNVMAFLSFLLVFFTFFLTSPLRQKKGLILITSNY